MIPTQKEATPDFTSQDRASSVVSGDKADSPTNLLHRPPSCHAHPNIYSLLWKSRVVPFTLPVREPSSLLLSVKLLLEVHDAFPSSSAGVTPAASAPALGLLPWAPRLCGPRVLGLWQACRVLCPVGTQAAAVSSTAEATVKTGDHSS